MAKSDINPFIITKVNINMKIIKVYFEILFIICLICPVFSVFAQAETPEVQSSVQAVQKVNKSEKIKNTKKKNKKDNKEKTVELTVNKDTGISVDADSAITPINLDITDDKKAEVKLNDPVEKIEGQLFESEDEKMQHAFQIQKKMDIEDISLLWESTVERNTVIKFALKKLAMPAEQRRIHSSLMARSVSALINGVSILPNILGADGMTSTASMAGGSLANRIIQNKTMPKVMPLTDSELIQLAKLVSDLQDKIIKNYYEYKSSIEALRVSRQNILLQNKSYSEALHSGNSIAIIAASALYDKELYNEMRLKQQIKLSRLELERLAGPEIISQLSLTKLESFNVDAAKDITAKNKKGTVLEEEQR